MNRLSGFTYRTHLLDVSEAATLTLRIIVSNELAGVASRSNGHDVPRWQPAMNAQLHVLPAGKGPSRIARNLLIS